MARTTTEPYLLSVAEDGRPPSVTVGATEDEGGERLLVTPVPAGRPGRKPRRQHRVRLLWPPAEPGGYSLVVDGVDPCVAGGAEAALMVSPTKAVLHGGRLAPPGGAWAYRSEYVPLPLR